MKHIIAPAFCQAPPPPECLEAKSTFPVDQNLLLKLLAYVSSRLRVTLAGRIRLGACIL